MAEIGGKLIGQFAACLAKELAAPAPTPSLPTAIDKGDVEIDAVVPTYQRQPDGAPTIKESS